MNSMKMRTLNTNEVQARMQQEHRYQLFPQIKAQCKPAPYVFQISGVNEKNQQSPGSGQSNLKVQSNLVTSTDGGHSSPQINSSS